MVNFREVQEHCLMLERDIETLERIGAPEQIVGRKREELAYYRKMIS